MSRIAENLRAIRDRIGMAAARAGRAPAEIRICAVTKNVDLPEIREKKLTSMDLFREGMDLYFSKNFSGASAAFRSILEKNGEDQVAKLFMDKSDHLLREGVPDNWTGVDMMEWK